MARLWYHVMARSSSLRHRDGILCLSHDAHSPAESVLLMLSTFVGLLYMRGFENICYNLVSGYEGEHSHTKTAAFPD